MDFGDSLVGVIVGDDLPRRERPGAIASCRRVGVEEIAWTGPMGAPLITTLRPIENRQGGIREAIEPVRYGPLPAEPAN